MAKILLVEDDINLGEIYQARMEAEGYTVVAAADGETALALAAKEKPDLIISDVMMPKISGFEMLDILRNTDGLKHTRVIMLTALGQAEDKTRADALGADKYLVKSQVTLEDIVSAAKELLGENDPLSGDAMPTTVTTATTVVNTPLAEPPTVVATPVQPAPAGPLAATEPAAMPEPPAASQPDAAATDQAPPAAAAQSPADSAPTPELTAEPASSPSPSTADDGAAATATPATEAPVNEPVAPPETPAAVPDVQPAEAAEAPTNQPAIAEPPAEAAAAAASEPAVPTVVTETDRAAAEAAPYQTPAEPAPAEAEPVAEQSLIEPLPAAAETPLAETEAATEVTAATGGAPQVALPPADQPQLQAAGPEADPNAEAPEPTPALQTDPMAGAPAPAGPAPSDAPPAVGPEPTAETTAPTAVAIDEQVVANAVDKLLAKTEDADLTPDNADNHVRQKVIEPLPHPAEPSLQELLAKEQARETGAVVAPEPAAQVDGQPAEAGAPTPVDPVGTTPADPDAVALAQAQAENAAKQAPSGFDPTKVAL